MLVLSRQKDESIIIGDDEIRITIVDIRGDKVRLGITAPPNVVVHREEVFEAIKKEMREAANLQPDDLRASPGKPPPNPQTPPRVQLSRRRGQAGQSRPTPRNPSPRPENNGPNGLPPAQRP